MFMEALEFKEIKRLLNVCYQCGTCVSSCAAGLVNPQQNLRRLIQNLINTADESELNQNDHLWLCTNCYQCEDRCPEGVPLTTLLIRLRNMAAARGFIPASVQKELETIAAHGFTYPPAKSIISRRRRLGLPDLPRPADAEMQTLIDSGQDSVKVIDRQLESGGLTRHLNSKSHAPRYLPC
jgi:heterodisulfide reductase subunit C